MEPEMPKVFKGNCKVCNCHLPPGEMSEAPQPEAHRQVPQRANIYLKKKREYPEEKSENEESEHEEEESEGEYPDFEKEAAPEAEFNEIKKSINERAHNLCKKKWEIKEEQELLRIKEEEIELDCEEMDIEANKLELKKLEKDITAKKAKLKDLYVRQLNLESYIDGEDDAEKEGEKYDLEMEIECLETDIELLNSRGKGLELMIEDARRKIMVGRAKIAKERKDIQKVKEIREREMKEEEEGKWPGEPRWLI